MTKRLRLFAPVPLLATFVSGLATLAGPPAALADPPTLTIVSPASGAVVGNSVTLQADIVSPIYQITSVNAQTAFGTGGLSRSGNTWSGSVSLPSTTAGNQTF